MMELILGVIIGLIVGIFGGQFVDIKWRTK